MHLSYRIMVMSFLLMTVASSHAAGPDALPLPESDINSAALPEIVITAPACASSACPPVVLPGLIDGDQGDSLCAPQVADRLWVICTRHLGTNTCFIDLERPDLRVSHLDACGYRQQASLETFFSHLAPDRPLFVHIHGNRMTDEDARRRGRFIHHKIRSNFGGGALDYAIFSWPSERTGMLVRDGRIKADRTDSQGLYLAWLLRELVVRDVPVVLVGYSFGGRVATGSLHALAGGSLDGRALPGDTIRGANIAAALVAPAVEEGWLEAGRYHGLASQNIRKMVLFYNPRDAILRRYWLIDLATRGRALGFSGPQRLAPGYDGNRVPLVARNCAPFLGIRHSEVEYYTQGCKAGKVIASLGRDFHLDVARLEVTESR